MKAASKLSERGIFFMDLRRGRQPLARDGRGCVCVMALLLGFSGGATAAEELKIGGTGAALGGMRLLGEAFAAQNPDIKVNVLPSLGSGGGVRAVLQGAIELAVASRPLNDGERKSGAVEFEYARTPFVFAVSTKSNVTATTLDQLSDIYAQKIQKWPNGRNIRLVLRPVGDSDSDQTKSMSPKLKEALLETEKRPGMVFAVTDQDAATSIESIAGAIGPSTLALITSEKRELRALKLDGVEPTVKNLGSGAYRHYKTFYIVTGPKTMATARKFAAFVQSQGGREILSRSGHWVP